MFFRYLFQYLEMRFGKATRRILTVLFIVLYLFLTPLVMFIPALALSEGKRCSSNQPSRPSTSEFNTLKANKSVLRDVKFFFSDHHRRMVGLGYRHIKRNKFNNSSYIRNLDFIGRVLKIQTS